MIDILLLEDDLMLGESVVSELQDEGLEVDWAKDATQAGELCYNNRYHLYLFDVNLPIVSGFEFLKELRESGDITPAIFLTSKNKLDDISKGFEVGAIDYIKKPFDMEELIIRLKSKLPKKSQQIIINSVSIDTKLLQINCHDRVVELSKKEYEIATYFLTYHDRVISKDEIISQIYQDDYISDSTMRVYINKIKNALKECIELENIRGVGYRIKFR